MRITIHPFSVPPASPRTPRVVPATTPRLARTPALMPACILARTLACMLFCILARPAVAAGWTQHAADAQRTGYVAATLPPDWEWRWSWNGPDAQGGLAPGHHELPRSVQPVIGGGFVYIADGEFGLHALDVEDGGIVWTFAPGARFLSTPAFDPERGVLFAGAEDGRLYKIDPALGGAVLGFHDTGQPVRLPVALAGGTVYAAAGSRLHAVSAATFRPQWIADLGARVATPPAVSLSRDLVLTGTEDLYLRALRRSDGTTAWATKPTACVPGDPGSSSNRAELDWSWPVVAEVPGLVLLRYRIDWQTMWNQSPYPTTNSQIRAFLTATPTDQCLFALDLDDGSVPFVCNVGNGGWGDGGYMPMGPPPCVRTLSGGSQVALTVIRGDTGPGEDGRSDSHFGELVLDATSVPGTAPGEIRWIAYGDDFWGPVGYSFQPTDEQPFLSAAGDRLFAGHWALGLSLRVTDRSPARGAYADPIQAEPGAHFVTSQQTWGFDPSHYLAFPFAHQPDWRGVPFGFYIYFDEGNVYDQYWSEYACWIPHEDLVLFRSCDSAVVCLGPARSGAHAPPSPPLPAQRPQSDASHPAGEGAPRDAPHGSAAWPRIAPEEAASYMGQEVVVEMEIRYAFDNGKQLFLGSRVPHLGSFAILVDRSAYGAFPKPPVQLYPVGARVRAAGRLEWYQGTPVVRCQSTSRLELISG